MRAIFCDPKKSAIISLLLALPFIKLFLFFILGFKPLIQPLASFFDPGYGRMGSYTVLGVFILLITGFVISIMPLVWSRKTGENGKWLMINRLLSLIIFLIIAGFISAIIIDQYPCWVGVPNCD
jgi:hypothetical protein